MPPVTYSGALQPKKKSELQDIAAALRLSDQGTKDELQGRIKKHLDDNQDQLEENPTFAGLFGRRKRSVQPQAAPTSLRFAPPTHVAAEKPRSSLGRRVTALDPIRETTPTKDLRDVSTFLKRPPSPLASTPDRSPRQIDALTPSSLPPLPPSPIKSIVEHLPKASDVTAAVQQLKQQEIEFFIALRVFLSNSRNIWSLTAVFELLYVLSIIIPWQTVQIPLSTKGVAGASFPLNYPPFAVFQTAAFWQVILHWATPTLLVPAVVGTLISFNPTIPHPQPGRSNSPAPIPPFDPLTASIIRLAAQFAYPYNTIATKTGMAGLDVLGSNWRILSASVGAAFAFAEAIAGAPQVFAKTLIREQQAIEFPDNGRALTPSRLALMAQGELGESEID